MTRTVVYEAGAQNDLCIGYFGDSIKELDLLFERVKNRRELHRTREQKEGYTKITIWVSPEQGDK